MERQDRYLIADAPYLIRGTDMDTKEAITAIGDKIETNAEYYAKKVEKGAIVKIEEVVEGGVINVWIEKRTE